MTLIKAEIRKSAGARWLCIIFSSPAKKFLK